MCDQEVESCDCVDEKTGCTDAPVQTEGGADAAIQMFPGYCHTQLLSPS